MKVKLKLTLQLIFAMLLSAFMLMSIKDVQIAITVAATILLPALALFVIKTKKQKLQSGNQRR